MRVLIDGIVFENTYQKGIRRYVNEVLRRTTAQFSLLLENPLAGTVPEEWSLIPPMNNPPRRRNLLRRFKHARDSKQRMASIREHDVFHSPWFRLAPTPGMPTVVTVHDMVSEAMPAQYWGDAAAHSLAKRDAIQVADAIIVISETTKADLLKLYPDIATAVHVIPHGADHLTSTHTGVPQPRVANAQRGAPYVLYVGDRVGYKNFQFVLEAMLQSEWPTGMRLKVAGPPLTGAEEACLRFMALQHAVDFCGLVSDEDLSALYANAAAFVFPSLFEGFGFPLLEAQARMAPVVANDMAVFHEVGGDAFLPCDCRNPAAIATAIGEVMAPELRNRLLQAGRENVKRFTWDETARKTRAVWESVAKS